MTYTDFFIRIVLCFVFGGTIGLERQWRQRMAGIRTNVLVSLGAFLFVTLSLMINDSSATRVAAQVVSGIGFLGAGVIIRDGLNIRGLNTAATLWCAAAIGTLTGAGLLIEAAGGTVFILIANIILRNFTKRFQNNVAITEENEIIYVLWVVCKEDVEFHIRSLLMHMVHGEKIMLVNLESTDVDASVNKVQVKARILSTCRNHESIEKIASRINLETEITSIGWEIEH